MADSNRPLVIRLKIYAVGLGENTYQPLIVMKSDPLTNP
ncbi:hypothetical protein CCACVL1_09233, partial [Corchorus capsularis]